MTTNTIEREAKLFEAGSYPERGVEISEEDLDRIVENTDQAPIRIEHTSTPFDGALGVVKSVYRKGRELFGRLCFTQAAWELISAANAKRLSVAIRKDKSGIAEVSLVREPCIADAAVFSEIGCIVGEAEFETVSPPSSGEVFAQGANPSGERCPFSADQTESEVSRLTRELAEKDAQARVDALKRAGKITPASEVFARAILRSGDASVVTFGDQPTPVSQVFLWFLESQPNVIEFSELAPASGDRFDEPEVFTKLGVTTSRVERCRAR